MKKLIFSALVATALFVSSCGKDDDNGGGSTSLTGDWYLYAIYKNQEKNGQVLMIVLSKFTTHFLIPK